MFKKSLKVSFQLLAESAVVEKPWGPITVLVWCCEEIFLVQPSTGAAERVFSILNAFFGHQQNHALQDYLECSIMAQYNKQG